MYLKPVVFPPQGILDNLHNLANSTFTSNTNESKIDKTDSNQINNNNVSQNNTKYPSSQNNTKYPLNQFNNNNNNTYLKDKTLDIKSILDINQFHLIDYGEKSYGKLCNYISKYNCLMWLGKFSPSVVENLWDNYADIVKAIHDRKGILREKFAELMIEEEKKLDESDHKAKKHLLNVFLKGNISYEYIKVNYRNILSLLQGNNPNEEEEELVQEDDQFLFEMKMLIDHFIEEDFEAIDSFLSGEKVKGNFLLFNSFIYAYL